MFMATNGKSSNWVTLLLASLFASIYCLWCGFFKERGGHTVHNYMLTININKYQVFQGTGYWALKQYIIKLTKT